MNDRYLLPSHLITSQAHWDAMADAIGDEQAECLYGPRPELTNTASSVDRLYFNDKAPRRTVWAVVALSVILACSVAYGATHRRSEPVVPTVLETLRPSAHDEWAGVPMTTTQTRPALTIDRGTVNDIDAEYGAPTIVTLDGDYSIRVKVERDQDTSIMDDHDWYGALAYIDRRDHQAPRPDGFDGRARKLRISGDAFWWQPPADVADDQLHDMGHRLAQLIEYGFVGVIVELLHGTDAYDRPIVVDHASLWGIDSLDDGYLADVLNDLLSEIGVEVTP